MITSLAGGFEGHLPPSLKHHFEEKGYLLVSYGFQEGGCVHADFCDECVVASDFLSIKTENSAFHITSARSTCKSLPTWVLLVGMASQGPNWANTAKYNNFTNLNEGLKVKRKNQSV